MATNNNPQIDDDAHKSSFLNYSKHAVFLILIAICLWMGTTISELNSSVKVLANEVADLSKHSQTQLQDHETRMRNVESLIIEHNDRIKELESHNHGKGYYDHSSESGK